MNNLFRFAILSVVLTVLHSCTVEDPALPDNLVDFESDQLGMLSDENELSISINFSREVTSPTSVSVQVEPDGVVYGTDFTTDPAAVANMLVLTAGPSTTSVTFTIRKVAGALFDGDETIRFTIQSVDNGLIPGGKAVLTLTFGEILATSGTLELNGGGALYPNKVFVDFSGNRQTAILRTTWDLGFSTTDDFRVVLNTSNGTMVRALNKTDLNTVTAADTLTFGSQLSLSAVFAAITNPSPPAWVTSAIEWIDDPTGDLTKTATAAVSATVTDNKVYIINRGHGPGTPAPGLGWKKFRVLRNGNNYTLQHADIGATTFSELLITKDADYRFQFVHFTNGVVSVDPTKTKWDIAWTGFTNSTNFGSGPVPYYFQDIILQNILQVQTSKILTSAITYENFAEANLTGLTFSSNQIGIGADWRSGGGPGVSPFVRTDRYYIIKDGDGNFYKVRFTALTTNGERGRPQLEFALVKKAG